MKYTIVINQKALFDIAPSLDLVDGAILDYVYHLCASPSEAIAKQRVTNDDGAWTWVNYAHMMADMPLLKINTGGAISRRIKVLEELGFIASMKGKGFRLYVRLLPLTDLAFTEGKASVAVKQSQLSRTANNHNTSNQDTSDQSGASRPKEIVEVIDAFKEIHPSYGSWYRNKTQRDACDKLIEKFGLPKVLGIVAAIPSLLRQPYCPKSITTPHELLNNLPKLAAFTQQQKQKVAKQSVTFV